MSVEPNILVNPRNGRKRRQYNIEDNIILILILSYTRR